MSLGGMYSAGTVSIDANGLTFVGSGTGWSLIAEIGDWLFANGHVAIVSEVTDDTHLQIEMPWTGGALAGADYRLIKMSWLRYDPALTQSLLRELLTALQASQTPVNQLKLTASTVTGAGSAATAGAGALAYVTDLVDATRGVTATGGGANAGLIFSNGSAWKVV